MDYYNEFESFPAQWLRNLGAAGQIPKGVVDERSIRDVRGADLAGFRQAHFFAGIGGWPLALRLAGWPDDEEVWTGSCPCQPFSTAGKRGGTADSRHLWPDFFRLIAERKPTVVFGEQVASKAGRAWLAGVRSDLEALGYAVGSADLCAAGVGAPHIRQRLFWVADRGVAKDAASLGRDGRGNGDSTRDDGQIQTAGLGTGCGLVNPTDLGPKRDGETGFASEVPAAGHELGPDGMGVGVGLGRPELFKVGERLDAQSGYAGSWSGYRIVPCTDGKARRTGSRVFPLAYGLPRGVGDGGSWRKGLARSASRARIGMLKGSGNAIVPTLAAEFIRAYMEAR